MHSDRQALSTHHDLSKRIAELEQQLKQAQAAKPAYEGKGEVTTNVCNQVQAPHEWLVFMPLKHEQYPIYQAPYPPGFDRAWIIQDAGN